MSNTDNPNPFPMPLPVRDCRTEREHAARWLGYEHAVGRMRGARIDVFENEFHAYCEGHQRGLEVVGK
ncbi:hypothetical protein F5X71_29630 [Nocardia brasiliensis]|uniref:Uncharacterized protein n=1 Tax=Nocardia brasiliensis TaxID=37326 RepID=A0A6G9XY99_NOCBR|nr:hypothetical protein [Nocardia brasiliensis]QIS05915.1 hypothetical protein F5X71_29630 [Nocardia brasiliensis]